MLQSTYHSVTLHCKLVYRSHSLFHTHAYASTRSLRYFKPSSAAHPQRTDCCYSSQLLTYANPLQQCSNHYQHQRRLQHHYIHTSLISHSSSHKKMSSSCTPHPADGSQSVMNGLVNGVSSATLGSRSTTDKSSTTIQDADHKVLPIQPTKHQLADDTPTSSSSSSTTTTSTSTGRSDGKLSKAEKAALKKRAAEEAARLAAASINHQQGPTTDKSVELRPTDYIDLKHLFGQIENAVAANQLNALVSSGARYTVQGWIRYVRDQKNVLFLTISDGTCQDLLQCTFQRDDSTFDSISRDSKIGASIRVSGQLIHSQGKGQLIELQAESAIIICGIPYDSKNNSSYPFAKAKQTLDSIRPYQHLRSRTTLFSAIQRVRSALTHSVYAYFGDEREMTYVDIPVLTTSECEGGCQPLQVTSLLNEKKRSSIPVVLKKQKDETTGKSSNVATDDIDFGKDFFDKPVYLTVSNQLHLECFALSHTNVYTMTIASRGEASATSKHLCTFNMIEWENCFITLDDNIAIAEGYIQYALKHVLQRCMKELEFLEKTQQPNLIAKLQEWSSTPFPRITHREAVERMLADHKSGTHHFTQLPAIDEDLSTEHEKYIVEVMYPQKIVVVKHYPAKVKAFYMPPVEENDSSVVHADCYDIVAPRCGEVVGASQRIWKADELIEKMKAYNIEPGTLEWYVELRRLGGVPHGGGGLGFDRLATLITGMENIKDTVTFIRTVHDCQY